MSAVEQEVGLNLLSKLGVNSVSCWGFCRNWREGSCASPCCGLLPSLLPSQHSSSSSSCSSTGKNLKTPERLLCAIQAPIGSISK